MLEHNETAGVNHTTVPTSVLVCPVLQADRLAGLVQVITPWENFLTEPHEGIVVVITNTCGEQFTYQLQKSGSALFLGAGDWHNPAYTDTQSVIQLTTHAEGASNYTCGYSLVVYSSDEFHSVHMSKLPYTITFIMAFVFIIFVLAFFLYDNVMHRHNEAVSLNALKADQILSSLFPSHIKDRLMTTSGEKGLAEVSKKNQSAAKATNLAGFFAIEGNQVMETGSKPIADLFPETTVLFADIAGFTAWSSVREPCKCFIREILFTGFESDSAHL